MTHLDKIICAAKGMFGLPSAVQSLGQTAPDTDVRRRLELAAFGAMVWQWLRTSTKTEETYKRIRRGSTSDTPSDKSDKNIKKFNSDVQRMFDHFPPEVKKERRNTVWTVN